MPNRYGRLTLVLAVAVATVVVVGSCDDDETGPEGDARVSAEIHDDPSQDGSSRIAVASLLPIAQPAGFSGDVSADARVEISVDGQTWRRLGDAEQASVTLQSSGDVTTLHADATVPADVYTRVRLIFEGADAELEAGSTIGGLTLDTNTTVIIASSNEIVIERQLEESLDLTTGADATIDFDLNSRAWVTQENVEAGAASESEFSGAVIVSAASE